VSSDKHGLSFPEPVDFSKLAGGANAANYALQFDYDRGSQSLGSEAITVRSGSNLYSYEFTPLSNGTNTLNLSALVPLGSAPALTSIAAIDEISMVFGGTQGSNITVKVKNMKILYGGAVQKNIASGKSGKTYSNNYISGFKLSDGGAVSVAVVPTPQYQNLQLTNRSMSEYDDTIFKTNANSVLVTFPNVLPVPFESDTQMLLGIPAGGRKLTSANNLVINMKRTGNFNMKVHVLPVYPASVPEENRRWFTIKTFDQDGVSYSESMQDVVIPLTESLSATDLAAFNAVKNNGLDKVLIEPYRKTSLGNDTASTIEITKLELRP
jgi:hypothetical protein